MRARSWRHSRRNSRTASSAGSRDGQPTRERARRAAAAQEARPRPEELAWGGGAKPQSQPRRVHQVV